MSSNTTICVFGDRESLSDATAEFIVAAAGQAVRERGRFLVALSGGGTPEPVYRLLAGKGHRQRVPWPAVHFFWGDERCVPATDPGSNYGQAKKLLLDHIDVPEGQVVRIKGELSPEEAAADYRRRLANFGSGERDWPTLDLALMGLGADGHTASLFPGPPARGEDRLAAIAVTADYQGRPADRVTLTPPVFSSSRQVLFLVYGAAKATAVAAILGERADPVKWPAARIQPKTGELILFLDEAAAEQL